MNFEKDLKEFIKKLKQMIDKKLDYVQLKPPSKRKEMKENILWNIDKLAGEKLITKSNKEVN